MLHQGVYGCDAPSEFHADPFNLPKEFVEDTIAWLTKIKAYKGSNGIISRAWIAKETCTPLYSKDDQVRLFLWQFEPDHSDDQLLIRKSYSISHYIDSRTISLVDAASASCYEKTFNTHLDNLHNLMRARYLDPNYFPNITIDENQVKEYKGIFSHQLMTSRHTPKIPYGVGMHVLSSAIEWVILYGDAIVDMTLYIVEELSNGVSIARLNSSLRKWSTQFVTKDYPGHPSKPLWLELAVSGLIPLQSAKANECFSYRLSAFFGACAVLIAMFKPIRQQELASIKRSDLLTKNSGIKKYKDLSSVNPVGLTESLYTQEMYDSGAFIVHENKKAGTAALNPKICRPIPYVSTIAFQQLQRLGSGLAALYGDTSTNNDRLFYFPNLKNFSASGALGTALKIDDGLIRFSDIINIPREKNGTRWYIRTHEMRKFFIYTMYYHESNYVADGIGWHAGHASARELKAYTSTVGVVDEVLELQTETVMDKLIGYELNPANTQPIEGLTGLYNSVLVGFNVKSIRLLPTAKFRDFVMRLIHERKVETSGYTISREMLDGSVLDTDIAIKFGEKQDAEFVPG
jgi:hypothetical protein